MKNPRTFDTTGLPLHKDAQTVIHERLHLDKADRNILYNDITVIDHALTSPWTVTKKYRRDPNLQPVWIPEICAEGNSFVRIGNDAYSVGPDGRLRPLTKDQPPPDLETSDHHARKLATDDYGNWPRSRAKAISFRSHVPIK